MKPIVLSNLAEQHLRTQDGRWLEQPAEERAVSVRRAADDLCSKTSLEDARMFMVMSAQIDPVHALYGSLIFRAPEEGINGLTPWGKRFRELLLAIVETAGVIVHLRETELGSLAYSDGDLDSAIAHLKRSMEVEISSTNTAVPSHLLIDLLISTEHVLAQERVLDQAVSLVIDDYLTWSNRLVDEHPGLMRAVRSSRRFRESLRAKRGD